MFSTRYRRSVVPDDVESLQTDIMRFMAIIGFCLMVIFAIVQSLPQSGNKDLPQILNQEVLEVQVEALNKKAQLMAQTIKLLKQEAEQAINNTKKIAQEMLSHQMAIEVIKNDLENRNASLYKINAKLKTEQFKAESIAEKIAKITAQSQKRREQAEIKHSTSQSSIPPAQPELNQAIAESSAQTNEEKGLFLEFSSNDALLTLLKNKQVRFFVQKQGSYIEFTDSGEMVLAKIADGLYEMAPHTVPAILAATIKKRMTLTRQSSFAVALNPNIQSQVSQLVRKHESGTIMISENGRVIHKSLR